MIDQITEETFLQQTKNHRLTVIRDDGLYRHLHLGKPGTRYESWDIVTWPGYLAMVGDMGDWVFERDDDMFVFFRSKAEQFIINPRYLAEKLQAQGGDGWEYFSISAFRNRVEILAMECENVETYAEVSEEHRDTLLQLMEAEDECAAVVAIREFREGWIDLTDFWDDYFGETSPRFIFACYAIAWSIRKYDELVENVKS